MSACAKAKRPGRPAPRARSAPPPPPRAPRGRRALERRDALEHGDVEVAAGDRGDGEDAPVLGRQPRQAAADDVLHALWDRSATGASGRRRRWRRTSSTKNGLPPVSALTRARAPSGRADRHELGDLGSPRPRAGRVDEAVAAQVGEHPRADARAKPRCRGRRRRRAAVRGAAGARRAAASRGRPSAGRRAAEQRPRPRARPRRPRTTASARPPRRRAARRAHTPPQLAPRERLDERLVGRQRLLVAAAMQDRRPRRGRRGRARRAAASCRSPARR